MRPSQRQPDQLREIRITRRYTKHAEGSVLIECGDTRVLCTASIEDSVPPFLRGAGRGWVTAEYGMLPRSTHTRNQREAARGKQSGRTLEIQRLIGRALCLLLRGVPGGWDFRSKAGFLPGNAFCSLKGDKDPVNPFAQQPIGEAWE